MSVVKFCDSFLHKECMYIFYYYLFIFGRFFKHNLFVFVGQKLNVRIHTVTQSVENRYWWTPSRGRGL